MILRVAGIPIYRNDVVPEGTVIYGADFGGRAVKVGEARRATPLVMAAWVAGLTFWRLQHPGVEPMFSRHCRGLRELERDRRRYPRSPHTVNAA